MCRGLKFSLELRSLWQNRKRIWTIEHEGTSSQCTLPIYIIDICQSRSGPGKQFCYIQYIPSCGELENWRVAGSRLSCMTVGPKCACLFVKMYIIVKKWISPFMINNIPSFSSSLRFPYHTFFYLQEQKQMFVWSIMIRQTFNIFNTYWVSFVALFFHVIISWAVILVRTFLSSVSFQYDCFHIKKGSVWELLTAIRQK